ncbi:hypothetical protein SDC9_126303 [bioreactor metagenome]|uniref:Uncharacterized protein n=1 Tax=bioreactor metagenome TaxID=1076179 RepID=A0A645CQ94_9ZZZZ
MGPSGDQDRHQHVVVGVGELIAGGLGTDVETRHAHRGGEVTRPVDQRLHPRRGPGDRLGVEQATGVLDLGLDPDPADRQPVGPLHLGQQQVEGADVVGALDLWQHQRVDPVAGAADDLDHVVVRPLGGPVVDPDGDGRGRPVAVQVLDHPAAGLGLGRGGHRVLQVEEDRVDPDPEGLGEEAVAGTGHREDGAADGRAVGGCHTPTLGPGRSSTILSPT